MTYLESYNKILFKKYGYETLKPEQYNIIDIIINKKKDVLGILATGFGKSLCYQMPYLISKKCVIVVSPLIALMNDQKKELKKLKIPVVVLNSTCKNKEEEINDILENDKNKIIYITPEYMQSCEAFIKTLVENDQLCLIAIDEAHCVSTWGMDFRKSYVELKNIRNWVSDIPILALTATASQKVRSDISKILQLNEPEIIVGSFDRPNLYISVQMRSKDQHNDLFNLLNKYEDDYKILYCKTREETEKLSDIINTWGFKSCAYHAGLSNDKREKIQRRFIKGKIKTMCATVAFGMGINIKNVRLVIHYNCPKNMESYYQEIGRAGRDGLPSECYMFYSKKDFILNKLFLESITDPKYKLYQEEQIKMIEKYVYYNGCRRIPILNKFDDNYNKKECSNCDNCCRKIDSKKDYSICAYLILDLINKLNGSYGINTYINILRGSNAKNITPYMKNLPYYNIGKFNSVDWYKDIFNGLMYEDFINERPIKTTPRMIGYTVECTDKAKEWLKNIKNTYKQINDFDTDVVINKEDRILLTESTLMKNNNKSINKIINENVFTDDVLKNRFGVSI